MPFSVRSCLSRAGAARGRVLSSTGLRLTVAVGMALGAAAAKPVAAQTPAAPACKTPEFRQFDFWVGDWDVVSPDGKPVGKNTVERVYGGCVVQEHWAGATGDTGTSVNTYDAAHKQWHQTWVDNQGQLLQLNGTFAGDTMSLSGDGVSRAGTRLINRIRWSREAGDANKVRQIWDTSTDGGKTWKIAFNGLYLRAR